VTLDTTNEESGETFCPDSSRCPDCGARRGRADAQTDRNAARAARRCAGHSAGPRYRSGSEKEAQKEKLWELIRKVFDFEGITVLAVGQNWKRFSPEQKKVFTDLFTTRLGNSYLNKIQGSFNNEKVEFLSEEMLSPTKAASSRRSSARSTRSRWTTACADRRGLEDLRRQHRGREPGRRTTGRSSMTS